jgi:hypothetical protein
MRAILTGTYSTNLLATNVGNQPKKIVRKNWGGYGKNLGGIFYLLGHIVPCK